MHFSLFSAVKHTKFDTCKLFFCSSIRSIAVNDKQFDIIENNGSRISSEPAEQIVSCLEHSCGKIKGFTFKNTRDKATSMETIRSENQIYETITIDKTPYTVVSEGEAEVLFPSSHDVFYNPVQEFNRDISIAVMKQFIKNLPETGRGRYKKLCSAADEITSLEVNVLEALAASGLRSVRYAKEIPGIKKIIANDMSRQAFESIERNIKHNKVEALVSPSNKEASLFMYMHRQFKDQFDIIDLDPYGTAAPFLDSAVQCVTDGGLLMVTCTDMAILCGNGSETCHAKYGAVSLKTKYCHELALRIVLQSIESHANRYGRYIEPLLSLSADFYVRLFVRIFSGPIIVKQSSSKLAMLYHCLGCETFKLQYIGKCCNTDSGMKYSPAHGPPVNIACNHCGQSHQVGGPIWASNMHNKEFVKQTIELVEQENEKFKTSKRVIGMLSVIYEELDDCPLFYTIDRLCSIVHVATPNILQFRSALLNAGYRVSSSHTNPISIKTDAPSEVVWDIIRTWASVHPGRRTFDEGPPKAIMSKEPSIKISFESHPGANPESRLKNLLRFQVNPEPHWGPKCRAKTSLWAHKQTDKQQRFQGKRKKNIIKVQEEDLKKFPCKKFKENECKLGDECRYSHDIETEK